MKNFIALALAVAFSASLSAQGLLSASVLHAHAHFDRVESLISKAAPNYRLAAFQSDVDDEFCRYHYNADNRLVAILDSFPFDYWYVDSLRYNDLGQLVRIECWQWLNESLSFVNYVEYAYNDLGLKASRTNYNFIGGSWELGGVYRYAYNADGHIVRSELDFMNRLYQTVDYFYDGHRLVRELWANYDFDYDDILPYEAVHYLYSDGRLTTVLDSIAEYGSWYLDSRTAYSYDAAGNCTSVQTFDDFDQLVRMSQYEFSTMLAAQTLIPSADDLEMSRPLTYDNTHVYTLEHFWTLDANGVLQYVCDYLYAYDTLTASIVAVSDAQPSFAVSPNPAVGQCRVRTPVDVSYLDVFDAMGRQLSHTPVFDHEAVIDLSALPQGIYFLRAGASCGKVVKR